MNLARLSPLRVPDRFRVLPHMEQLHVGVRLWTAPLTAVAEAVRGPRVLEVGCGHGALASMLLDGRSKVTQLLGVDVDSRKIGLAKMAFAGEPHADFQCIDLQVLAASGRTFDSVVVCDVLYLVQPLGPFVAQLASLVAPGGQLVLKETEQDGSLKALKCLAQEYVTVRLARRTKSAGHIALLDRNELMAHCAAAGLRIERCESLAAGYTTPHFMLVCGKV